mgnify:FL=1
MTAAHPLSVGDWLREIDAQTTKGPWTLATQVELGAHGRTPIGIVGGCSIDHDHGRIDSHTDEQEACVVTEFARVHLNDSRKPPLHPDNAREMRCAEAIVTLRNALPALASYADAADALRDMAVAMMKEAELVALREVNAARERVVQAAKAHVDDGMFGASALAEAVDALRAAEAAAEGGGDA